jgi:glycine cleavage system H protein
MVDIPDNFRFTSEHEWVRVDEDLIVIGITDYAQDALGEIVYIELPNEGDDITKGDTFGGIESTKSVSELYSPVSGEVVEVNEALLNSPEIINEDPYNEGWLIKVRVGDKEELEDLMDSEEYSEFIEKEEQ